MLGSNLEKARLYLRRLRTAPGLRSPALFRSGMVIEQLPDRVYPNGVRSALRKLAAGFEKGGQMLFSQSDQTLDAAEAGNLVALEVLWTGRLAVPFGPVSKGNRNAGTLRNVYGISERQECGPEKLRLLRPLVSDQVAS